LNIQEIPLTADNQQFNITLGNFTGQVKLIWRGPAGWIIDLMDSGGNPLLSGAPLVSGVNLLAQYPQLGIDGALVVISDDETQEYPSSTNLGTDSHLYFAQNS
jgi:hypothetical protein